MNAVPVIAAAPANSLAMAILVLDDDPFELALLQRMLALQGYHNVTLCSSARDALECVGRRETLPQLILCDLNMPGMDGTEFARALVTMHYFGSVILVSGEDERLRYSAEKLVRAHSIRILGHLGKPVSQTALAALLDQCRPSLQAASRKSTLRRPEDLRAAIKGEQLVNYYQPKVEIATGSVVGVEALVRWLHPQYGLIPPDQFISVAEDYGMIDDLTLLVVDSALRQAGLWRSSGLMLNMAINVSMHTVRSLGFPDVLSARADIAGIAHPQIIVEITEGGLMGDVRTSLEVLTRLRLKGFRLSIDDFGTGYSSLANLRDIPFDELKIDRGFVHGAASNRTLRALYDASLGLAKQLGIDAVAEGVENEEDWALLQRTGCPFAQGYFISKPMPGPDLQTWLRGWRAPPHRDAQP